jgi:predicted  nucleic acid-binding Zn-ribbon protein
MYNINERKNLNDKIDELKKKLLDLQKKSEVEELKTKIVNLEKKIVKNSEEIYDPIKF